jgi:hypothetical protein
MNLVAILRALRDARARTTAVWTYGWPIYSDNPERRRYGFEPERWFAGSDRRRLG